MVLWNMVLDNSDLWLLAEVMTQTSSLGTYKLWDTAHM